MNTSSLDAYCACCGDALGRQTPGQDVCARCEHLGCRPDQGQPHCFGAGCIADDLGGISVAAGIDPGASVTGKAGESGSQPCLPPDVSTAKVARVERPLDEPQTRTDDLGTISDGFGSTWGPCSTCGMPMQVVRPGKAQCVYCEDLYTERGTGTAG